MVALHRALQTRVPSGKCVLPALQLLRPRVGYTCQEGSSKLLKSSYVSLPIRWGLLISVFQHFMSIS